MDLLSLCCYDTHHHHHPPSSRKEILLGQKLTNASILGNQIRDHVKQRSKPRPPSSMLHNFNAVSTIRHHDLSPDHL